MSQLIQASFTDEIKSRYLTYALSTIMSRALPDVRDGLKPVQRRVMYVMRTLRLDPDKGYKKCARVVGDVIGKYHPHGDQSVYDAMVRLAQDFALRYPLVDGQGNFGSIDGDSAAAMRYTEARMTKVAQWLMKDIDSGTVDWRSNYDETESEPVVFPGCFPNLLANGATGIAVGMATSIPPHNVGEICNALKVLLKNPDATTKQLTRYIKGPDFPTGGVLAETEEAIDQCYETGRGSLRLRAKWEREELARGMYQIVITEIPFQVQKSKVIEKVADLIFDKKLPWLADVRDESERDIRIVLEPKSRTVDAEALMEALFKTTELESRISFNMNAINGAGMPELMSLKRVLEEFIAHRRDVMVRKANWRLGKIAERLHLLAAYLVVYLNIDEVIEIIKTNDDPAPVLMERFGIDKIQAEAILNMRLRSLRKLEEMEIRSETDALTAEQAGLNELLVNPEKQTAYLTDEVEAIKNEFADKRRTEIGSAPSAVVIPLEAQIEREPMTVLLSKQGWVKTIKGHMAADQEVKYKEGDEEAFRLFGMSTQNLCVLAEDGRVYTLPVSKLPAGRGFGEPIKLMVELEQGIAQAFILDADKYLVASAKGYGFVVEAGNLQAQVRTGKQVLNVSTGDKARFCKPVAGDAVACYGANRKLLVFPLAEVPEMQRGKGVKLMNLKDADLLDMAVFSHALGVGLSNGNGTRSKVFTELEFWQGKRAQAGKLPPHGYQSELAFYLPEGTLTAEDSDPGDVSQEELATKSVTELVTEMVKNSSKPEQADLFATISGDDTDGEDD
ncbi:MAG: DNA topoisomerase IV subunit A [Proteobacteria bacterium]|nr:DNA topoisomerase IV subunit A [Pseudomonadota bacterium]